MKNPLARLEKPKVADQKKLLKLLEDPNIRSLAQSLNEPEYLYWDKAQYTAVPYPATPAELWYFTKQIRAFGTSRSPVRAPSGDYFQLFNLRRLQQFYYEVDTRLRANMVPDSLSEKRIITHSIMEEAIASSQIEGANTTRRIAKRMLIENRRPRTLGEQMILNNNETMMYIVMHAPDLELTIDELCRLHSMLTKDTLHSATDVGTFRTDDDQIVVETPDGEVAFVPPPEEFYRGELKRCIAYANDELSDTTFVHPCIKAIILHFWIGYLHPFNDGNGRLARAVFYWYMIRKGYRGIPCIPFSRIIKKSPKQYGQAYLYTEQDDYDLTYFIDYNTRKISQAMREFDQYLARKRDESVRLNSLAKGKYKLSERQTLLLRYLLKNASATTTISTHAKIHGVSRLTAQHDLRGLESQGFLRSEKRGRDVLFSATSKVELLLK